jgi:CubicO group peptidase (beta-lactamase class C family)
MARRVAGDAARGRRRVRRCRFLAALLAMVIPSLGWARVPRERSGMREGPQGGTPEAVAARILEPAMRKKELPGLILGVMRDGRVVVEQGYGVRTLDGGQTPDENTVFYIGSVSKAMTAVGAMILVDRGKLDLQAPASRYVKGLPRSWRAITVAQFMAHQSGIPNLNTNKLSTFEAMLHSAASKPMMFPPGTKQTTTTSTTP